MNVAVIYYSATGTVAEIAREIGAAAEQAGAEVRLRRVGGSPDAATVAVASADDMLWADAVLFGSPTRFGNVAAQLKEFIDGLGGLWQQGLLADKVYSGFTSTATAHGGHESTLLALSNTFHHFGGIIVPPGYTHPAKFADGNPYGTSHFDEAGTVPVSAVTRAAARVQAERVVKFARAVRGVAVG